MSAGHKKSSSTTKRMDSNRVRLYTGESQRAKLYWWNGPCGHEWETSAKARSAGEKCPICSGARVIAGVNDLNTTYPSLAEEWSSKNKIKPTELSAGSHKKVLWHGKCGHEWAAEVKSRVNGTGCPYCSHNIVLPGFNDLASRFPK